MWKCIRCYRLWSPFYAAVLSLFVMSSTGLLVLVLSTWSFLSPFPLQLWTQGLFVCLFFFVFWSDNVVALLTCWMSFSLSHHTCLFLAVWDEFGLNRYPVLDPREILREELLTILPSWMYSSTRRHRSLPSLWRRLMIGLCELMPSMELICNMKTQMVQTQSVL